MTASAAPFADPDREAQAALARGDRDAALAALMAAHGRSVYRYCRRMLGDDGAAEDAQQLVFVQAYEDLARFEGRSALRTWLFGIARHRCLDALRSQRRRERRLQPLDERAERPGPARLEEDVARQQARRALAECLDALLPRVREAVLLRYQVDLSYVEMAAVCGEEPATLQARVARALPPLRQCLEAKGFGA